MPLRTGVHYLFNHGGALDTSPGPPVLAPEESTQPPPWGLMADGIVGWHFFDAESGLVPEEISPSILPDGGKGRVVALAATPFAQAEGWASRAAVAIAQGWAKETLRIFLMDLGLEAPSLHRALGLLNREGVSDAFLFGASVQRIAQPALDGAIFFASAGTAASDSAQILGHPRWNDLAGGFSEADATLLLFLPTDIPGADKILARVTDVLFLGGEGEPAQLHLGPAAIKVVAMVGPMGSATEGSEHPVEVEGREDDVERGPDRVSEGSFGLSNDFLPKEELGSGGPDLDLDRSLSLAEGFMAAAREDHREVEEAPVEPSLPHGVAGGFSEDGEFALESHGLWEQGFGDGGQVSDELESGSALDRGELWDRGPTAQEVPDFGAEFADLPEVGGGAEAPGEWGAPGGGMVGGSDFTAEQAPDSVDYDHERPSPGPRGAEASHATQPSKPGASPLDRPRPMSKRRPPPKKRLPIPLIAGGTVGVLGVLIAAIGTAMGIFNVPGFGWLQDLFGEVPYPDLAIEGLQPNEPVLRFSLELDAYEEGDLRLAVEMRNTLRQRLPSLIFSLTPNISEGVVTYALHAGPAIDVVEAGNLRAPLGEILTREDPDSWRITETPRAFLLGERGTLAEAEEFLASVEAQGVLCYIIRVTYPNDTEAFEVLSGAFEGVSDARGWQLALREMGFRDVPLIERRGLPPE